MCSQMEEEGGGRVREHPHGARDDQAGPPLQGRGGQLRSGETEPPAWDQADQNLSQGEHQYPQGKQTVIDMRNYRAATTFYMCHIDMNHWIPPTAHQAISLALVGSLSCFILVK